MSIPYSLQKQLPLVAESDVIVIGGGPGGLGAAVMAARAGASVTLIERYGFLGGMAASGEVNPFMPNHAKGEPLDRPVYLEWVRKMAAYLPPELRDVYLAASAKPVPTISKDIAMLSAEDLCLEAGVKLLFHHTLADVIKTGSRIAAVVLLSKSGFVAARAKTWVDATGDGDLAARSGCPFEKGGVSGFCQPMTLCFKLSGVDKARCPDGARRQELYLAAKAAGKVHCPRENVLMFNYFDADVVHFNTTRVVQKDATDGVQLSEAEIEGRRQLRELLAWMRAELPGYEQARIHSIAHHIGVRESRRILGRAYITRDDFVKRSKFPDAIARVSYGIDIHSPTGGGTELLHMPDGEFYEIPYGCIVPRDCDNLTVGGRPISVDHAIHSSMRVMPPACSVGQAAGLAAALAAQRGVNPAVLDGVEIRHTLKKMGAYL
jgi:glycine/D-amino acid oxidase-like deaminating enzyme